MEQQSPCAGSITEIDGGQRHCYSPHRQRSDSTEIGAVMNPAEPSPGIAKSGRSAAGETPSGVFPAALLSRRENQDVCR